MIKKRAKYPALPDYRWAQGPDGEWHAYKRDWTNISLPGRKFNTIHIEPQSTCSLRVIREKGKLTSKDARMPVCSKCAEWWTRQIVETV